MPDMTVYAGLFFTAFLTATVFPAQSEAVLSALLLSGNQPALLLIGVASAGNILGSVVNWGLGRGIDRFHDRKWFPVKQGMRTRAQAWYQRYGRWSLLLSWVPIIGDPLTLAAGIMHERFGIFLLLVAIAKTGRYLALWAILELAV